MNHIVDTCPLTKFEGGLNLLHEADDDDAGIHSDCSTREITINLVGWGLSPYLLSTSMSAESIVNLSTVD